MNSENTSDKQFSYQENHRMQAEGYDLKKLIKPVAEIMEMRYEDVIDSEMDRKSYIIFDN